MSLWLVGFIILLPAIQGFSHDRFIAPSSGHPQHAANDARHFGTFSSFSASSALGAGKLFPYTGLIALPPMADLSLSFRSSTRDRESISWLLEATIQSRAPPSLKP
jgi:hypothetical protein